MTVPYAKQYRYVHNIHAKESAMNPDHCSSSPASIESHEAAIAALKKQAKRERKAAKLHVREVAERRRRKLVAIAALEDVAINDCYGDTRIVAAKALMAFSNVAL